MSRPVVPKAQSIAAHSAQGSPISHHSKRGKKLGGSAVHAVFSKSGEATSVVVR